MKLNLNFPSFSGNFGLWVKRAIRLGAILALLFGSYHLYKWSTRPPVVYRIAMDPGWYPLALYGKEHNTTAFTQDLIRQIGQDQSIKIEMIKASHNRLIELLNDGNAEGILTTILPDPVMEAKYEFSDPYYRYGAVIVVNKGSTIRSLADLDQMRLGVKRTSSLLYRLQLNCQATVVPYTNELTALHALSENKLDAVIVEQLLTYLYFGAQYPDQLAVATQPLTNEGLRLMTFKKNDELVEKFNAGLQNLKDNGTYDKLLTSWDIYDPEVLVEASSPLSSQEKNMRM